ncbi:PREDICTED: uncharacterized protein LOC109483779 [Branchiostoma belcheri]|uniref:Uncharacterized protein LOC109483779 n=1 Tax=Branchiostoma belcheri TaxID=7741 RepID=A0A6P5AK74_BRABE|nr:PREDICTED: uncharacterized protein LOC109483779 [Branchiostoma belcheri]
MADPREGAAGSDERAGDDNPWYRTICRQRMRYVFCAFFPVAFALVLWGGMTFAGSQQTNSSESIILLALGFLFLLLWMVAVGHYDYAQRRYGVPVKYCTLVNEGSEENSFRSTVRILAPFAILGHAQEDASPGGGSSTDGRGSTSGQAATPGGSGEDRGGQYRPWCTDTSGAEGSHAVQSGVGFSEIIVREESDVGVQPVHFHPGQAEVRLGTAHGSPPPYEQATAKWTKDSSVYATVC